MEQLIVVGCGEHFRVNVGPSLAIMQTAKEATLIATVDVQPKTEGPDPFASAIPHIVRLPGQSLSFCLRDYRDRNPVVLLSHSHNLHAKDAIELLSTGFRVILEKPYALNSVELRMLKDINHSSPRRLALAEYYMMMKAAPLLLVGGLLKSESFYLCEPGYCETEERGSKLSDLAGTLEIIGRPRMVYADVLEGKGLTGRFEHRGRQFADARSGIGVILDLGIHALAPLVALEEFIGSLPPTSNVRLLTAVCEAYLRFAAKTYQVPAAFVPETYAEFSFATSIGVPVIITLGKYVLENANQRRIVIVGDEGEAILDMSRCKLVVGRRDNCPSTVLSIPKRPESKYRAVLRGSLGELADSSPYTFDAFDAAIRSNEFALDLFDRSREKSSARPTYAGGAGPRTIFPATDSAETPSNLDVSSANPQETGAKIYYEHQYTRMTSLEDQAFKMSAGVLVLTSAVFTFASRVGTSSFLSWKIVMILMAIGNLAAILYVWRVNDSVHVHQKRAKHVLENSWHDMWLIDQRYPERFVGRIQMRPLIMIVLHLLLLLAALAVLYRGTPRLKIRAESTPLPTATPRR